MFIFELMKVQCHQNSQVSNHARLKAAHNIISNVLLFWGHPVQICRKISKNLDFNCLKSKDSAGKPL